MREEQLEKDSLVNSVSVVERRVADRWKTLPKSSYHAIMVDTDSAALAVRFISPGVRGVVQSLSLPSDDNIRRFLRWNRNSAFLF